MSLPLYLLRHSPANVSSALYVLESTERSVQIIAPQSQNHSVSEKTPFLQIGHEDYLKDGEHLTYAQLLERVLQADKVVIL